MRSRHDRAASPASLSDVLEERAAGSPAAPAYTFLTDGDDQSQTLTYMDLWRRVQSIAATLQALGMAGERAVLLYPPGLDFVAAVYACMSAGVVAVPAYPPRTSQPRARARLDAIMLDAAPQVVLTHSKLAPMIRECLAGRPVTIVSTDEVPVVRAAEWRWPETRREQLAVLQYTSGSTAAPKGVMLTHANLLHNAESIRRAMRHTPQSRGVVWLPPYHDMGLIGGIFQPLYVGFPITLMAPAAFTQKPLRWLTAISRFKGTTSGGPNFAYDLCVKCVTEEEKASLDLSSWEIAFNGAEPVDPRTLDRFADAFALCGFRRDAFYPCYGLAEATLLVTGGNYHAGETPALSCGTPQHETRLVIVDPTTSQPRAPGVAGEIWVSGPGVAAGYWNQPEATAATFAARTADGQGPFLRTGDLGTLTDGKLRVSGRIKDLIIIAGVNHYPQDIERTVQACHPSLRPAAGAAFAVVEDGRERLVVVQELDRARRNADPDEVIAGIRQAVAEQHELRVSSIVLLRPGQVPLTSSGKVQRYACRDGFVRRQFQVIAEWHAEAETVEPPACERAHATRPGAGAHADAASLTAFFVQLLADVLAVNPSEIDPAEPWARYGLDSLKAAALANAIATHVGREIPLTLFWDYPSVAALAAHLAPRAAKSVHA